MCLASGGARSTARSFTDHPAEPDGFFSGSSTVPVPATLRGATVVHTAGLVALLKRGRAVVIDVSNAQARPPVLAPGAPWLPVPHRALPHALWIPGAGAGSVAPAIDVFYRGELASATSADFDVPVVVYCHTACWLSWNAAKRAVGYGYRRVYWYEDGIEGWTAARQATVLLEPLGPPVAGPAAVPTLVVLDLELSGDLGGPELAAEHDARLRVESARLRDDLAQSGLYRLVDVAPAAKSLETLKSQQAYLHDCNGCDLDVGRELHADRVLVAWVDRVSGLILTLTYEIHDVNSGQIVQRKSYDFRGDSDNAWNHAVDYMVRDLQNSAATAGGG